MVRRESLAARLQGARRGDDRRPDRQAGKLIYYHGTQERFAYSILTRGFSLDRTYWGRGLGRGVYLGGTAAFAAEWGPIVLGCSLQPATRMLWHGAHDPRTITSLKREFGADIARPELWKVLPKNKQFRRDELIQLWNFLIRRHYQSPQRFRKGLIGRLIESYPRLHEQLRLHGFHGVGFPAESDWPEVLVFNPSRVQPQSAHRWIEAKASLGAPIPAGRLQKIEQRAAKEWDDAV